MLTMATRDAIWDFNLVTKKSFVNSTLLETFGYPIDQVQDNQMWWENNLHQQDRDRVINGLNEAMEAGRVTWQDEYLFRCADGTYKKILDRSFIMHDENGKVYRIIGAMQDVTPQRQLQEQLFDERIKHEKELSQIILSAQERERRRIALELHDNINQLLTTIKLHIDLAHASTEKRDEILTKVEPMINNVISEVRMLSRELAPSAITDLGLSDSLKDMASTIQRTGKIYIEVDTSGFDEDKLSTDRKLTLYRIAQEQLSNIIKYSKATGASIRVFDSHNHVQMEIRDNGVGFNVHTLTSGMGFSNMRSRLEVFNGKLHLISAPGKGCELIINL
jgi:two-component system sensor histidine kinase UhpB